jgi:hypothetical protein
MSELHVGNVFSRKRGFCRPPEGYDQKAWWTPNAMRPVTAEGAEYLEIIEIVQTKTFGRMVIYRQWWLDPDGHEVAATQNWIPRKQDADIRAERNLLRSIASKKMEAVSRVAKETTPARTATAVNKPKDEHRLDLADMSPVGTA